MMAAVPAADDAAHYIYRAALREWACQRVWVEHTKRGKCAVGPAGWKSHAGAARKSGS